MRTVSSLWISVVLLAIAGCQGPQQPRTPVARIDNETLTLEEIEARFDSSRGLSRAQVHEYIQRWLTSELLYQEAVRRGLDQTDELETRLSDMRRQLAINALLEEEIYSSVSEASPDTEIVSYYNEHQSEFILSQNVALVSFILFSERDPASSFRTKIMRGTPWSEARDQTLSDAGQAVFLKRVLDSTYFSQTNLFPSELWRVVATTARQEPSFPVRTDEGFYVIITWKLMRRGEIPDLPYVQGEIRSRLAIGRRQQIMERLIENLRSQHVVQILMSSVPQDSLRLKPQE